MRFEPVTGTIGAVVADVDPRKPCTEAGAATLRTALREHGVLFFEASEPLSDEEFSALADAFGGGEAYGFGGRDCALGVLDNDLVPMEQFRVNCWHTDGTALESPPQSALLTPLELPPVGGDTMWASMYAAWEALSSRYQRLLEGLEAEHNTGKLPFLGERKSAVHPVVIRDPVTKRQALFVNSNWTDRIVGMTDAESANVLAMLFDHVNTPEFHVRLRWRPGTVAVWDERVTQHRGVADFTKPRKLRRIAIPGGRPSS